MKKEKIVFQITDVGEEFCYSFDDREAVAKAFSSFALSEYERQDSTFLSIIMQTAEIILARDTSGSLEEILIGNARKDRAFIRMIENSKHIKA